MKLTKVIRLEIVKPENEDWKIVGSRLWEMQRITARALNYAMREYYVRTLPKYEKLRKQNEALKARGEKELKINKPNLVTIGIDNFIYAGVKKICSETMNSVAYNTISYVAKVRWDTDMFPILVSGQKSLSTYRADCPIYLRATGVETGQRKETSDTDGKEYVNRFIKLKLRPTKDGRVPADTLILHSKSFDDSRKAIWDRLLSGEYKLGQVQLLWKKRLRKWFVNISYIFDVQPDAGLDSKTRVGVDLGVTVPVCLALNNEFAREFITGDDIDAFRRQLDRRRRSLRRNERKVLERRKGHGKNHKLASIEKLQELEDNFRRTANHRLSKAVVKFARDHHAGVIVMEDLSGLRERKIQERIEEEEAGKSGNRFLENWNYFELQTMIKQKAEEVGISVEKVDPYKTSQRCSKCGHISPENRPATEDRGAKQSDFKCVSCCQTFNADYNAARNIATPGIEGLIRTKLKEEKGTAL